jgi:hypothetical protein
MRWQEANLLQAAAKRLEASVAVRACK